MCKKKVLNGIKSLKPELSLPWEGFIRLCSFTGWLRLFGFFCGESHGLGCVDLGNEIEYLKQRGFLFPLLFRVVRPPGFVGRVLGATK